MVTFAPELQPINPPEWTNISRPISDVKPDVSSAIAIRGGAEVLDSTVKAADSLTKSAIRSDVDEGVDRLRDAYTDSLKTMRNMQIGASQQQTLLPDGGDGAGGGGDAPQGLQNGIDRVKQIGTALAQNGTKINDTLYTGALNATAKELRAKYPGYRDYIDEQIKSVSGIDPANAFMRNLMEDINRNAENNKTEVNRTRSSLQSLIDSGFHDAAGTSAATVKSAFDAGRITMDQVNSWINNGKSLDYDIAKKAQARKDRQEDEADASKNAVTDAGEIGTRIIKQGWSTVRQGKGTDTFASMSKFLQEHAGDQNITDEMARTNGQKMQALRNQLYQSAWDQITKAGLFSKGGENSDAIKKALDTRFHPMDMAIQSVFNKDWGSAYSHMNFNEAISNDSTNLLNNATDDDVRKYNRMSLAIGKQSPQAAAQFFQSSVLGNVPQKEKEYLKNMQMELLTQPDADKGAVSSAQAALDKLRGKGASSPKTFDALVKTVNYLSDPKWSEENKVALARGFFDPKENGELLADKNFQKDTVVNGRQINGKYFVFSTLSSPQNATAIQKLGQSHPDISTDYRVMMERQFGEQLFSREIRDLGQDQANASTNRGYKMGYISEKGQVPRFAILRPDNTEMTTQEALTVRAPLSAVNRLNSGISGMYNVYGATGSKDPSVDILNTMYKYGYQDAPKAQDLTQGWTGEATDVPRMIWRSLVAAQQDRLRKAGEAMRKNQ